MKNEVLSKLAIQGGSPLIQKKFPRYNSIGKEEMCAAHSVIESGVLSKFIGCWEPDFFGGPQVQRFERDCESYFNVKHAITVNSWTSGLIAAVGAIGVEPGDEVIVSPWTMCASATAILHWNAIPIFADIEPETFCIDPRSVEANVTPRTKGIIAVDIFGHSADIDALQRIAKKYNLKLISDTAQAPGAFYKNKYAGTQADIGGYSLNYHKHIHTGEGGILVTNDDRLADRMRLIRNHAEAVVGDKGDSELCNMIGYNFRLGEIECAIGIAQLKKLQMLVENRQRIAEKLTQGLKGLSGLRVPVIMPDCSHVFYQYPIVLDLAVLKVDRKHIYQALVAEGVAQLAEGYANLHLLPMYQKKMAYGTSGFPWTADFCRQDISYQKGICPVAEYLHDNSYLGFEICSVDLSDDDVALVVHAFEKVWNRLGDLRDISIER